MVKKKFRPVEATPSVPPAPESEPIAFKGWISGADESDRERLTDLGIKVGPWVPDCYGGGEFRNCELTASAMTKLDPLWTRFIWAVDPV